MIFAVCVSTTNNYTTTKHAPELLVTQKPAAGKVQAVLLAGRLLDACDRLFVGFRPTRHSNCMCPPVARWNHTIWCPRISWHVVCSLNVRAVVQIICSSNHNWAASDSGEMENCYRNSRLRSVIISNRWIITCILARNTYVKNNLAQSV